MKYYKFFIFFFIIFLSFPSILFLQDVFLETDEYGVTLESAILEKISVSMDSKVKNYCSPDNINYSFVDGIKILETANGKGQMKYEDGMYILKLKGSHYEMGFQHGYLLSDTVNEDWYASQSLLKYWVNYLQSEVIPKRMINHLIKRISDTDFRALYGFYMGYLAATNKTQDKNIRNTIIVGYVLPDICNITYANMLGGQHFFGRALISKEETWEDNPPGQMGCSSIALLPDRNTENALLYCFNFDYGPLAGLWETKQTIIFFEPVAENNKGLVINNPAKKPQTYLSITSAGMHTPGLMGVNENGITYRVQNNFTNQTDSSERNTNAIYGQPLLNFGSYILRKVENIEDPDDLEDSYFSKVKEELSDAIIRRYTPSDYYTASGWTHIITNAKKTNGIDNSQAFVLESAVCRQRLFSIPIVFETGTTRYSLFDDIYQNISQLPLDFIWHTNFYLDDKLRESDIFERRSCQLDRLGRYLRIGQLIKEKIANNSDYKFTLKDITTILADDKDIFSGNNPRINVHTITALSTVTTGIFSVTPRENEKPDITLYISNKKHTPTSWGKFFKLDYNAIKNSPDLKDDLLKYCPEIEPLSENDENQTIKQKAWKILYDIYRDYTYDEELFKGIEGIEKLISRYIGVFPEDEDTESIMPLITFLENSGKPVDPLLYFHLGLLYSNLSKVETSRATYHLRNAEHFYRETIRRIESSSNSSSHIIPDIHLKVVTLFYLAKVELTIAFFTKDMEFYSNTAIPTLEQLEKDADNLFYNIPLSNIEIKNVFSHFNVDEITNNIKGLKYRCDRKLKKAIDNLVKAKFCWPAYVESHTLSFDGPEYYYYLTPSNSDLYYLQRFRSEARGDTAKFLNQVYQASYFLLPVPTIRLF
ncbi:MAG: hypothetical protein JW737_07575 [Acidobacteria bacterium]|nr:hypothetical protein [Acidobacteriota bacterium]